MQVNRVHLLPTMVGDPAVGVSRYRRATMVGRESFASEIQVGEFYICSMTAASDHETHENVVLLHEIRVDSNGMCKVVVTPLDEQGVDAHTNPLLVLSEHVLTLSPHALCHPVHVVPYCSALLPSACTVRARAPPPHKFEFSCFGLCGVHAESKSYVSNSYLVK